jgi:hypothetical protein
MRSLGSLGWVALLVFGCSQSTNADDAGSSSRAARPGPAQAAPPPVVLEPIAAQPAVASPPVADAPAAQPAKSGRTPGGRRWRTVESQHAE